MYDLTKPANLLNNDPKKISEWTFKLKIWFKPGRTTQAHKIIFSLKNTKQDHPIVFLNEAPAAHTPRQKHLGMHLNRI